jgi:acyl-CoA thioester hydrolase
MPTIPNGMLYNTDQSVCQLLFISIAIKVFNLQGISMTNYDLSVIFSTHISIRWGDMDAYGHVNNTLYLRFMEEARIQLLLQMGYSLDNDQEGPVVINIQSTFLQPVIYPDTLTIDCYAAEPGNSSFMTYYKLYSQQQNSLVCEGSAKVVWINKKTNRSSPLPTSLRAMLEEQDISAD